MPRLLTTKLQKTKKKKLYEKSMFMFRHVALLVGLIGFHHTHQLILDRQQQSFWEDHFAPTKLVDSTILVIHNAENKGIVLYPACQGRFLVDQSFERPANWTIVMSLNEGLVDFFVNWWLHYRELKIDNANLVLMAEDDGVYNKLHSMNLSRTLVVRTDYDDRNQTTDTNELDQLASQGHYFGSEAHRKLISTRPVRLLSVLCSPRLQVQNLIYSDVDSVWKQNPIPYMERELMGRLANNNNDGKDIVAQIDNPRDEPNGYCTGLLGIRGSLRTAQFLADWEAGISQKWKEGAIKNAGDQPVFREVIHAAGSNIASDNANGATTTPLHHGGLDISLFPPGRRYFQAMNDAQRQRVVVVHNNWMKGHHNKLRRFRNFGLWKVK